MATLLLRSILECSLPGAKSGVSGRDEFCSDETIIGRSRLIESQYANTQRLFEAAPSNTNPSHEKKHLISFNEKPCPISTLRQVGP